MIAAASGVATNSHPPVRAAATVAKKTTPVAAAVPSALMLSCGFVEVSVRTANAASAMNGISKPGVATFQPRNRGARDDRCQRDAGNQNRLGTKEHRFGRRNISVGSRQNTSGRANAPASTSAELASARHRSTRADQAARDIVIGSAFYRRRYDNLAPVFNDCFLLPPEVCSPRSRNAGPVGETPAFRSRSMKALVIASRFPWPQYTGDRLAATIWIAALAPHGEVALIAPSGKAPDDARRFRFFRRNVRCGEVCNRC